MRRRRQKNTLLPKMIGIAVLVNAILLPILAQFGVFKGIRGQQHLTEVQLVQAPPPPPKPKAPQRKTTHHPPHHQEARRQAPHEAQRIARADNTPKIHGLVAPPGPGGTGPGVNNIVPPGTNLPMPPAKTPPPPNNPTPPPAPTPPPPTNPTPPQPTPTPTPAPAPPPPHVPVLVQASVAHRVDPQIPSDFSDTNLPVAFHAVFDIHADGTATVTLASGTGDKTLDGIALDAARQWTFKPATEDGKPVESYLRLTINFVPSDSS